MRPVVPTAQYPRSRYVTMQVILLLLLLGTVALAQWVIAGRQARQQAIDTISLGDFTIRMPDGWNLSKRQTSNLVEIIASSDETRRQMSVFYQVLDQAMTPMDYLSHSGLASGSWNSRKMSVDGYPGVYLQTERVITNGRQRVLAKEIIACVILPSHEVLTVQLNGVGKIDSDDQRIMQTFLKEIKTKVPSAPKAPVTKPPQSQDWQGV